MTAGLASAAYARRRSIKVSLAVDINRSCIECYKRNFPSARAIVEDVAVLFSGEPGTRLSSSEKLLADEIGPVDVMVGGPPCQGHSDLNNHTRRRDPKNTLYIRMARAAEVLKPTTLVVENVPAVQWDEHRAIEKTLAALKQLDYKIAADVLDLRRVGIPQSRKRHLLLATRNRRLDPEIVLQQLANAHADHSYRTVAWAIGDLEDSARTSAFDAVGSVSAENAGRIAYLFENEVYDLPNSLRPPCHQSGKHSYKSVYGRLRWDHPAQTITTGFGSMGQGRYVHPARRRTITPHEAARLQTFPDWFNFQGEVSRSALTEEIGNAVPPLLMNAVGMQLLTSTIDQQRPKASSEEVSRRMKATRRRDTLPEVALRSILHRAGFRFYVDKVIAKELRVRADLVFPKKRVAVFVDGCFWHSCPNHGTLPKSNRSWWIEKLAGNVSRDANANEYLRKLGWNVIRVWEHESPQSAADKIISMIRNGCPTR